MKYISHGKWVKHIDRLAQWSIGKKPAPVTVEWDLSNRCVLGCQDCLTDEAKVTILGRGEVSIAQVNPGDIVLAYDERGQSLAWAKVEAAASRPHVGAVYAIRSNGRVVRATGNHPFLTSRGWVAASALMTGDRVASIEEAVRLRVRPDDQQVSDDQSRVLAGEEASAVGVRVRMRQHGQDAQGQAVSRALYGSPAGAVERAAAGEQSHEATGNCSQGRGDAQGREASKHIGVAEASVQGWPDNAAAHDGRIPPASFSANAIRESHEGRGRCGTDEGDTPSERFGSSGRRGHQEVLGRSSGVQGACRASHEDAQPYVGCSHEGEESRVDSSAIEAVEAGDMVRGRLREPSDLVHGHWSVLGGGAESRLQGPRQEGADRAHGRILQDADHANDRQLRHSDDCPLSGARIRVLGGDRAASGSASDTDIHGGDAQRGASVLPVADEWLLASSVIDGITVTDELVTVYNLQTETGTYVADGIVVHNCHFAHTHTRGPWAMRDRRLPMAFEDIGDYANPAVVKRGLKQMADAGVQGVVWSGGGEPTTHPQWTAMVEAAAAAGLKQGMYTLGGLLRQDTAAILAKHASWVVVSLDCADAIDYHKEKAVPLDRFERACDGVRYLSAAGGTVGVSFLLHAENWHRIDDMLALGRSLGGSYVMFRPTINTSPDRPAVCLEDRAWITEALPRLQALESEPDVECDASRFVAYRDWSGREYDTCYGIRMNATITPDGRVWVCPQRRGIPGSEIGNLTTETFADLWARHPGQWTEFADCRVMCRLHLLNEQLSQVYAPQAHEAFL